MTEWFGERFAPGPVFMWLAGVFLLVLPIVWWRTRSRVVATIRFSSTQSLSHAATGLASHFRFVVPLLRVLAICCLLVALLRPQSGGAYKDSNEGIAIQMVLDVSGSMGQQDFILDGRRVRRLDAVKSVFEHFTLGTDDLRGREGDLIGMTKFAMYADTVCPLTLDHGSLRDLLRETEIPGWVDGKQVRQHEESGYTALGDAIISATDDLRRAGEKAIAGVAGAEAARSRVMILLTDGKNHPALIRGTTAPDPIEASRVAATLGIKIYTIGAIPSAPQQRRGFFMRGGAEFDEGSLQQIAAITGGKYFRATDTDSLVTIYDEIDRLERRRTGERTYQDNIRAATLAMIAGLGLLMLECLLGNTRFRRLP